MKWYGKLGIVLAGGICAVGISSTWAVYHDSTTIPNKLSTGETAVAISENFDPRSTFLPGETVVKEPYFINTGTVDLALRVQVKEEWKVIGDERENLETENVLKEWTDSWENDWVKGAEGQYYYKKILKSKAKTDKILNSVTLSSDVSNDFHEPDYSGAQYYLSFEAEAVPASQVSGYGDWGKELDPKDLKQCEWSSSFSGEDGASLSE